MIKRKVAALVLLVINSAHITQLTELVTFHRWQID